MSNYIKNSIFYTIKNNTNCEKNILIVGVVHGNEPQGEFVINEYLKKSLQNGKNRLVFVPRLNSQNVKDNKNGVDLNRNYPTKNWKKLEKSHKYYGGDFPSSEIETRFLIDLIEKYKFDAIVAIHAPFKIVNYDCDKNVETTLALAKKISDFTRYPVQKDIGYPTCGSFGTYCGVERDIPTITIEVDEDENLIQLSRKFEKIFKFLEFDF